MFGWLAEIYGLTDLGAETVAQSFKAQKNRMRHLLHESYAQCLIDILFNLIVEFPESESFINDLKSCMEHVNLRSHIISTLKLSVETRLLHPGT